MNLRKSESEWWGVLGNRKQAETERKRVSDSVVSDFLWPLELVRGSGWPPPGSSVHGIFQARILEWAAISFSRGSSRPRDWTPICCTAGRFFTVWARDYRWLFLLSCWEIFVSSTETDHFQSIKGLGYGKSGVGRSSQCPYHSCNWNSCTLWLKYNV